MLSNVWVKAKQKMLLRALFVLLLLNATQVNADNSATDLVLNKLEQLLQCEQLNNCPEDPTNPRNSYYLLGEKINQQLDNIIDLQKKLGQTERFVQLAQQFYQYPNPFVQLKALTLISQQTKNIETVNILLNEITKTNDKAVLLQTLEQLKRYPEKGKEIDTAFSQILTTGSFNASKALAKAIGPFINKDNISFYINQLNKLPINSAKYKALQKRLASFQAQ
jgi:hypothetical protein